MMRVTVPPVRWSAFAGAVFLAVLGLVVGEWAPLQRADTALSETCRAYGERRPGLVAALRIATDVMETPVFIGLGVAVALLFLMRRDRRTAGFVAAVTALIPVLWAILHAVLYRPRPVEGFVSTVTSNGFPSGHTTNAAAAGLVAVLLGWHRLGRAGRIGAIVAAAVFAAFIGATRVALLAHWPSDVVAGWLLALAVVPLVARAVGYPGAGGRATRVAVRPCGGFRPCGGSGRRCRPGPSRSAAPHRR